MEGLSCLPPVSDNVAIEGSGHPESIYSACNVFPEEGACTQAMWAIGLLLTDDRVTKNDGRV